MNQMTPTWLRSCTLGFALLLTPAFPAGAQTTPASASDLYQQATELYQKGRLLEAKNTILRIDLQQLDRAQRADVIRLSDRIDQEVQAMPVTELRLQKATLAFSKEDYRLASTHLQNVLDAADAKPEEIARATDLMTQVRARQEEMRPQLPVIHEQAKAAYKEGRYAESRALFMREYNSGIALELHQQAELTDHIEKITGLSAQMGDDFTLTAEEEARLRAANVQPEPATTEPAAQEPPTEEPTAEEATTTVQPPAVDLIEQARKAQAADLVSRAEAAQAEGRYADADKLYQQALAIDPDNAAAAAGQAQVQTFLNTGSILDKTIQDRTLRAQQLRAEFDNLVAQAQQALAAGDFPTATDLAHRAQFTLGEGRQYIPADEYASRKKTAGDLTATIDAQRATFEAERTKKQVDEISKQRMEEQYKIESERQRRISEKFMQVRRLQMAQKYEEAIQELNTLLVIDPGNAVASAWRDAIEEIILYKKYEAQGRINDLSRANEQLANLERQKISNQVVEYPEDWPMLTAMRTDGLAYTDSDADRKIADALGKTRVPVNFRNNTLESVLAYVEQAGKINMIVDWPNLKRNLVDPNQVVNLRLNDQVPLNVVLQEVLNQCGRSEDTRPSYAISNGILKISTKEALQENPVTHLYDIRDLLVDVPDFDNAPDLTPNAALDRMDANRAPGDRLFGDKRAEKPAGGDRLSRDEMIGKIKDFVTTVVDPKSWESNGGDVGRIMEINGNLAIATTERNHREISSLLSKLREVRSLQINVESRFLLVNTDFFEQIGFDLDVYWGDGPFNRDSREDPNLLPSDLFRNVKTGQLEPTAQRQYTSLFTLVPLFDANGNPVLDANNRQRVIEVFPDAGVFQAGRTTFTPQSLQNQTLDLAETLFGAPANSFGGQAMVSDPGMTYGVTYLDEFQVDLFIKATQADRRNVQLTAPKLTFFNGQRSFVQVTTSRFFISDLQPIVGEGSAGFDPTLNVISEGVVLDVDGTVSSDRRYVTMTVLTSVSKILDIQTTPVPVLVGGTVLQSNDQSEVFTQTAEIERPITQVSQVNTTVSVPDRGTIVLGGQSIRNDIDVETGVPVLSKIPIINRFFTNRITTTSESTLLILIKPTIIIQQENEDQFFPGLRDAIGGGTLSSGY